MSLDVAYWNIHRIIVHKIFEKKRDEDVSGVEYSEELLTTSDRAKELLKKRILKSFSKHSYFFKAEISNIEDNSFFSISQNIISNISNTDENQNEIFIKNSVDLANNLSLAQTKGTIRDSILIVVDFEDENEKKGVLLIKAELHQALTTKKLDGRKFLELLDGIFLSPQEKLYKIGLMIEDSNTEGVYPNNSFSAYLFDSQFATKKMPAKYFYDVFLGFSLNKNSKILTKEFYFAVYKFAKEEVTNFAISQDIISSLRAYMKNNDVRINARNFMDIHIPNDFQYSFQDKVLSIFTFDFKKDTTQVWNQFKKRNFYFGSNKKIRLEIADEVFNSDVKFIENVENLSEIDYIEDYSIVLFKGKPQNV